MLRDAYLPEMLLHDVPDASPRDLNPSHIAIGHLYHLTQEHTLATDLHTREITQGLNEVHYGVGVQMHTHLEQFIDYLGVDRCEQLIHTD